MGKVNIHGAEYPIQKVFSDDFFFTIPLYQRPYAWRREQAEELFDDLFTFACSTEERLEDLNPYFLGSIVLIKGDAPEAEIVDGQQRLTTLAILLAAIRSLVSSGLARELTPFLYQQGNSIIGSSNRYRLKLRERDEEFFREYIQDEGGIGKLKFANAEKFSDSQKSIRDNALLFLEKLGLRSEQQRIRLAQATITRCFLIVVSTPSFDSAYRIFSVLNDRGLSLSHSDILKADVIGKISSDREQARYTKKWEEKEEQLGRETFQSLFGHIRMISCKAKLQGTVLEEFRKYVWPGDNSQSVKSKDQSVVGAPAFVDTILIPYADAFLCIKYEDYRNTRLAEKVNHFFKWLNRIDNSDWIPPAMLYFRHNQHDPEKMAHFFSDLERLAVGLMILRANVNKRMERYIRLLKAIENNDDLYMPYSPLQLTAEEQKNMLASLNGNLYETLFCKHVLLRLDEVLADADASYNYVSISVEHVLPQNPFPDSEWVEWFPDLEEREQYVHRIGNLVLLSRRKNAQARNYDFAKKKRTYFLTAKGIAPFALTTQVVSESQWTPDVVRRRQQALMSKLREIWRLNSYYSV